MRSEGSTRFREAIAGAHAEEQASLVQLADWADALAAERLVRLHSIEGKNGDRFTLVPYLADEDRGIATGWNDSGRAHLTLWRLVIEKRAPGALSRSEQADMPGEVGQGFAADITGELLEALTAAYREAASGASSMTGS